MDSIFNRDLFQSQESRERFSNTQVANDDHTTVHTDKYIKMTMLYLFRKAMVGLKGLHRAEVLKNIGHKVDGLILSRGWMLTSPGQTLFSELLHRTARALDPLSSSECGDV